MTEPIHTLSTVDSAGPLSTGSGISGVAGLQPGDLFQGRRARNWLARGSGGCAERPTRRPHRAGSGVPLAKRVYDLRHACLTTWLNNGVPPAQVAEWAGNGVPVLLSAYAWCLSERLRDLRRGLDRVHDVGAFLPES